MNEMDLLISEFLTSELSQRIQKNRKYSLRAFAKYLGVSPAALSLIMNKKRPASRKVFSKIQARALSDQRFQVRMEKGLKLKTKVEQIGADNLGLEVFEKISSWIAYGILGLIETKSFRPELTWIAKRLGITVHECREAVNALLASGILCVNDGKWSQGTPNLRINNQNSTALTRRFQKQMLEKALESLESDPIEIRDISSMTLVFPANRAHEAKEMIRQFRHNFAKNFEAPGDAEDVYNLTVQLVPATKSI